MTQGSHAGRRVLLTLILGCGIWPVFSCARLSQNSQISQPQSPTATQQALPGKPRINLNEATTDELERLPGIGKVIAARIVSHRARYGKFRRAEHLMMVRGLSDGRFRRIREFITVE
ncbi:MAG TPA: helix-hairpin-helix domain-containing protein [Pyrinomonadaceae bacterium]|jgi:competence protein ComEA|nr:helix-hairpin-helix domain-containing protein [Pyrinomonadaceae bacterium]